MKTLIIFERLKPKSKVIGFHSCGLSLPLSTFRSQLSRPCFGLLVLSFFLMLNVEGWSLLWLTIGKWMCPDRFPISGTGDRGVIIMPNKCHDSVRRWRAGTRRVVREEGSWGQCSLSLQCPLSVISLSIRITRHASQNYGLYFLPSRTWSLCRVRV